MTTASRTATTSATARAGSIALWVARVLLAVLFLRAGVNKFLGGIESVHTFDQIGAGQWLRYLTGTLEVAGAIGLLIPRLNGLAATGLAGVMAGAVFFELTLIEPGDPIGPAIFMVMAALLAWVQRARTAELIHSVRSRSSH